MNRKIINMIFNYRFLTEGAAGEGGEGGERIPFLSVSPGESHSCGTFLGRGGGRGGGRLRSERM